MTAKKAIKKSIISPVIKKPNEYEEVFPTIEIIKPVKIDLNWVSVRRKIQSINFFKISLKTNLNPNFNLKDSLNPNFNLEPSHPRDKKLNVWKIYCNWFNDTFNKKIDISDNEDYKKFERQIRGLKDE